LFTAGTSVIYAKVLVTNRKGRLQTGGLKSWLRPCKTWRTIECPYTPGKKVKTMKGIIGKKIGMTSVFSPDGKQVPCTIIEAGPCVVTQVKTQESDGYSSLQLAFGDKKEKHTIAAEKNHFAKSNTSPKQFVKEFRNFSIEKNLGETITVDIFTEGEDVDVVGTSKGKGFQGVVKRHGFSGVGGASHGQHDRSRAPGSLGNSSDASRVMKGVRMAGRMGGDRVKLKSLKVFMKNYTLIKVIAGMHL